MDFWPPSAPRLIVSAIDAAEDCAEDSDTAAGASGGKPKPKRKTQKKPVDPKARKAKAANAARRARRLEWTTFSGSSSGSEDSGSEVDRAREEGLVAPRRSQRTSIATTRRKRAEVCSDVVHRCLRIP